MKTTTVLIFIFIGLFQITSLAQTRDYELGSQWGDLSRRNSYGGFYDYSDPEAVNISVSVWGFCKYPGKYMVPNYTTVVDLISFAGGPTKDSNLDDLRIYRIENKKEKMIPFNYNDLMWENNLESKYKKIPKLKASDTLVIPGQPRMFFTDWLSLIFSVVSVLSSLSVLILTISKK